MKQGHQRFRILVADIPIGQVTMRRALGDEFEQIGTDSLSEAKLLLNESLASKKDNFNLVVCGMHFDDCKMFDLLQYVIDNERFEGLPFLIIQAKRSRIPFETAGELALMYGALEMLDLQDLSTEDADKRVKSTVDRLFAMQR